MSAGVCPLRGKPGTLCFECSKCSFLSDVCVCVCACVCVYAQSCVTLCSPMDWSLPGFSAHGISQARILEFDAISWLQGIFPTQRSDPHLLNLLHLQADSLPLCHLGSLLSIKFSEDIEWYQFSSVQSLNRDSLWPHEPQHARPPCPSPTARVYPNPCPLSWWCHPTISSSFVLFSSCPQLFPPSESFPVSQLFTSGGQRIGVSASTSFLPVNTQDWSPLGWTGWISLQSKGRTLKSLLQHHSSKASILWCSAFFTVQLSHPYMTTGKTIALTRWTLVGKVMFLLLNMLPLSVY